MSAISVDTVNTTISFGDIQSAEIRLKGVAHRTPVITSSALNHLTQADMIYLKAENLQRMGAFKFRGAYNRLAQLSAQEKQCGVVTFSSGNHAQGVALAAKLVGTKATIVMPSDAPVAKLAATRGYGANVILYDRLVEDRKVIATRIAEETGGILVPPYDDPSVIAGQGTVALELIQETGPLDLLFVCLGGGGLLSGCAIAATALSPGIAIWGVEPEKGDDWVQSLAKGERLTIPLPDTIADGMQTLSPGILTFPIVQALCAGVVTVSDDEIRFAMQFAFERLKLVIEPSGAAALAAVIFGKVDVKGKRVGVTISGGNVDAKTFAQCIAQPLDS